jgi:WD40 repeat protein
MAKTSGLPKLIVGHNASSDAEIQPGLVQRIFFRGHGKVIRRIAWSRDGRFLATPSGDETIGIWDIVDGRATHRIHVGTEYIYCVAWSHDGRVIAAGTRAPSVALFSIERQTQVAALEGHTSWVNCLSYSPDGHFLASGSEDKTIRLWPSDGRSARILVGHSGNVNALDWSPNGQLLASASGDGTVMLWSSDSDVPLRVLKGHSDWAFSVSWLPDSKSIVSGSRDKTIRVWDAASGTLQTILEGHTGPVQSVSVSADGRFLASKADDDTVRLWRCDTWHLITTLQEVSSGRYSPAAAFHPRDPILASLGEDDTIVRLWDFDASALLGETGDDTVGSLGYTTARVALLGDSGVGKTGLGWRIAYGEFPEHPIRGHQFWVVDQLGGTRDDGTKCEAVLWDLAGQPDYRLIHALFLDKVDLGLLLFDPANRERPLAGVEYWVRHLQAATLRYSDPALSSPGEPPPASAPTLLVAARSDRGAPALTTAEIHEFCRRHGICAYLVTSARENIGVPELVAQIKTTIPWHRLAATTTTRTFRRIKERVLKLKASSDRAALLRPKDLRHLLESGDPGWHFTDSEMMTAVEHLANHGYVTRLQRASGEEAILLEPDLLVSLASSIVLEARRHERGLGLVDETRLLAGNYPLQELAGLSTDDRAVLLDAITSLFLLRNLCFRETINDGTCLVFPSLIEEKRPIASGSDSTDDVSYRVVGAVETVYSALVVQLGYTNLFRRDHHWQTQAQYELGPSEICGFRQTAERDGEIELVLSFSAGAGEHTRKLFEGAFELFLKRRPVKIGRLPAVICPRGHLQERAAVRKAIDNCRPFFYCDACGRRLRTPRIDDIGVPAEPAVRQAEETAGRRTKYEVAIAWVKAFRRDRGDVAVRPSCFISYAWGNSQHERWVEELAEHLLKADVAVIFDRWHNRPGTSITRFIERIQPSQFVCPVGTLRYRLKDQAQDTDPVARAELSLIKSKLIRDAIHDTIIPLLCEGTPQEAFPPLLEDSVFIDFRNKTEFFIHLFELVLTLHRIPPEDKMARQHRDDLRHELPRVASA